MAALLCCKSQHELRLDRHQEPAGTLARLFCHQLGFSEKEILINVLTYLTWLHSAQHFLYSEPIEFMSPGGPM